MNDDTERDLRIQEIKRICLEQGLGDIDGWDGDEIEELAKFLSEEEFQMLLDELEDLDDPLFQ